MQDADELAVATHRDALSMAELRFRLLSTWHTLYQALEALELDSRTSFDSEAIERLSMAALDAVPKHVSQAKAQQNSHGLDTLSEDAEAIRGVVPGIGRLLMADLVASVAHTNVQHDYSEEQTISRSALILILGQHGPREGFRTWASRILLLGPGVFGMLAKLLGPESKARKGFGPILRREFCEAVSLLNGHIDDAADWFDRIRGIERPLGLTNPHARAGFDFMDRPARRLPVSSTVQEVLDDGTKDDTLDFNVLSRTVVAHPRLKGADDVEDPLTLEEVAVRLIFVWGQLAHAFGLEPQVQKEPWDPQNKASRCSTRALIEQMHQMPDDSGRKRTIWPPSQEQWLKALRGTKEKRLLAEVEARAEAPRFAKHREAPDRFFPHTLRSPAHRQGHIQIARVDVCALLSSGAWILGSRWTAAIGGLSMCHSTTANREEALCWYLQDGHRGSGQQWSGRGTGGRFCHLCKGAD
jgi:hypothetical protein